MKFIPPSAETNVPLWQDIDCLKANLDHLECMMPEENKSQMRASHNMVQVLASKLAHLESEREMYKNMSESLKGDVKVLCRVRPGAGSKQLRVVSEKQLEVDVRPRASSSMGTIGIKGNDAKMFFFDNVFDEHTTDDEVFECVRPDILASFHGHQVCILAYGATGAGKTHTIDALSRRAVDMIEEQYECARENGEQLMVRTQMVEVYNESFRDLLSPQTSSGLKVLPSPGNPRRVFLQGCATRSISEGRLSVKLLDALHEAKTNRATAATNVHERSSRSHLIITLFFTRVAQDGTVLSAGKLTLVDLAGSERLKNTEAHGMRMREGQFINKSLAALGNVLWAHERKVSHIPFRSSKLTHLLQDSLGGQMSRTVMIIAASQVPNTLPETIASLQFGSRVNNLSFNCGFDYMADSVEQTRLRSLVDRQSHEQQVLEDENCKLKEANSRLQEKNNQAIEIAAKYCLVLAKVESQSQELERATSEVESCQSEIEQQKTTIEYYKKLQAREHDSDLECTRRVRDQLAAEDIYRKEVNNAHKIQELTSQAIQDQKARRDQNANLVLSTPRSCDIRFRPLAVETHEKFRQPMTNKLYSPLRLPQGNNRFSWLGMHASMPPDTPQTEDRYSHAERVFNAQYLPCNAERADYLPCNGAIPSNSCISTTSEMTPCGPSSAETPLWTERSLDAWSGMTYTVSTISKEKATNLGIHVQASNQPASPLLLVVGHAQTDAHSDVSSSSDGSDIKRRLTSQLVHPSCNQWKPLCS